MGCHVVYHVLTTLLYCLLCFLLMNTLGSDYTLGPVTGLHDPRHPACLEPPASLSRTPPHPPATFSHLRFPKAFRPMGLRGASAAALGGAPVPRCQRPVGSLAGWDPACHPWLRALEGHRPHTDQLSRARKRGTPVTLECSLFLLKDGNIFFFLFKH